MREAARGCLRRFSRPLNVLNYDLMYVFAAANLFARSYYDWKKGYFVGEREVLLCKPAAAVGSGNFFFMEFDRAQRRVCAGSMRIAEILTIKRFL